LQNCFQLPGYLVDYVAMGRYEQNRSAGHDLASDQVSDKWQSAGPRRSDQVRQRIGQASRKDRVASHIRNKWCDWFDGTVNRPRFVIKECVQAGVTRRLFDRHLDGLQFRRDVRLGLFLDRRKQNGRISPTG